MLYNYYVQCNRTSYICDPLSENPLFCKKKIFFSVKMHSSVMVNYTCASKFYTCFNRLI